MLEHKPAARAGQAVTPEWEADQSLACWDVWAAGSYRGPVLRLHGSREGFCEIISPPPGAGAVEPLVKLVEAATDGQRRATDGGGFQVEVVQHLLTMQMQHPQLRSAIRQVSASLAGAQWEQ